MRTLATALLGGAAALLGGAAAQQVEPEPEPEPVFPPPTPPPAGTCPTEALGLAWLGSYSKNSWAASPAEPCTSTCVSNAAFGPGEDSPILVDTEVVVAQPAEACSTLTNAGAVAGKIALVRRGTCDFSAKCYVAQQAGAVACIVWENNGGSTAAMRGGANAALVTIPSILIPQSDGAALAAAASASTAKVSLDCFAPGYVLSGCSDADHCGTFFRTAATCDGAPAFQQAGGGNVLFRSAAGLTNGRTRWYVGPSSRLTDCSHGDNFLQSAWKSESGAGVSPTAALYNQGVPGFTWTESGQDVGRDFAVVASGAGPTSTPPPPPPPNAGPEALLRRAPGAAAAEMTSGHGTNGAAPPPPPSPNAEPADVVLVGSATAAAISAGTIATSIAAIWIPF